MTYTNKTKMSDSISINNNIDRAFLHKKSERLAAAIFIVSNTMSDKEVIKYKIRDLVLDLVSLSIDVKLGFPCKFQDTKTLLEKKVLELMSIMEVASISGLISEMNFSVIKA